MEIQFVAGFGPVTRDGDPLGFWREALGLRLTEIAPGYFGSDDIHGVKAFALWPLADAAEATFGKRVWPPEIPTPQAWIEFDVSSPQAVTEAVQELRNAGQSVLREAHTEPWKQVTARVLSPEGLLVGITFTPWMHGEE